MFLIRDRFYQFFEFLLISVYLTLQIIDIINSAFVDSYPMGTLYYMMAVGYLLFLQEQIKGIISSQTCCAIILLSWVIRCAVSHPCGKARYATQCILGPLRIVVWSVCRSFCRSHSDPSRRANLPLRVFALVSVYSSNRP
jgi:hypothetical protein